MPASETRIAELRAELTAIRDAKREALTAASVGDDGRSLTRQRIDALAQMEAQTSWALGEALDDKSIRRIPIDYTGA